MQVELKQIVKVDVRYLRASCGVRYWEDAEVNGVEDDDGSRIPCRAGDVWEPLIDVDTGRIWNWTPGTVANIHYKVCDEGVYELLDAARTVLKRIDGYVPKAMCPAENGYGDYVIMSVDGEGAINGWRPELVREIASQDVS